MPRKQLRISAEQYHEMEDELQGVCKRCLAIRENTEADAEDYHCEPCDTDTVFGVMAALEMDIIYIIDEPIEDDFDDLSDDDDSYESDDGD